MGRGANKGDNRFSTHQDNKTKFRLDLVKRVLRELTKRKLVFPNLWQLAIYVEEETNRILKDEHPEIFAKKRGKLVATTLVREGSKYKVALKKHLLASEKSDSLNELQAKILMYQLENSGLKDELTALQNFAKKNLAQVTNWQLLAEPTPNATEKQSDMRSLDAAHNIILALVEASDGVFVFDNDTLINCTKAINNVIADEKKLTTSGLLNSPMFKGVDDDE